MEKEIAENLMKIATATDRLIGEMFSEIEKISDPNLKKKFNDATAEIMGYIARDIIFPLEKEYPGLNPDD